MDRIGLGLRCFEYAKAARWGEVKKLRDRIGNDNELKMTVLETVKGQLLHRRMYATTADFIEAFIGDDEPRMLELAKSFKASTPVEADQAPCTSPERVATELIRRVHLSGTQFEKWGDIISNPAASDQRLEDSLGLDVVVDVRTYFESDDDRSIATE